MQKLLYYNTYWWKFIKAIGLSSNELQGPFCSLSMNKILLKLRYSTLFTWSNQPKSPQDMGRSIYMFYLIIANILNAECTDFVIQDGSTFKNLYIQKTNFQCNTYAWIRKDKAVQQCFLESGIGGSVLYSCVQQPFARNVETNVIATGNVTTTNLTIVEVYRTRSDSDECVWSFKCTAPIVSTIITFNLKLYEKPRNLQCTHLFQADGLIVNCFSEGIYPQANFYVQINNSLGTISICQNVLDSTFLYYNSTCNFTFQTASLSIGKLEINMTVYPNVTALISDTNFGESRLLTLQLETPNINLTKCPEDIIEDVPFNCTCGRSDVSDILTNTSWLINGTEYSSSTSTASVLKISPSKYNTNYTCIGVNILNWKSSSLIYIPSVFYAPDIISLLVNDISQNQTIVDNKSTLRIICKANGNPQPTLYLTKDRNRLVGPTQHTFIVSLKYTVNCMDSGKYICSAYNTIGKSSQKISTVFVKCPQQLQDPLTNKRVLTATERQDVSLNISVFGYPKPDTYDLIRNDINKLTVNGSIQQTNLSRTFKIAYHEDDQNPTYGDVTFTIFNISSEDFANYTLIIYNGENGNLTYKISVEHAHSSVISNSINGAVVGGCVGAFVVIILTSVVVLLIRRKRGFKCKGKEQKNIELSSNTTNKDKSIKNSKTLDGKKMKNVNKKEDTDVAEKLDSIIIVLKSLETRQKVLEDKLNAQSERNKNPGNVAQEAHYDSLRQEVDNIDYTERTYAIVETGAYQEIKLETEKTNYENVS